MSASDVKPLNQTITLDSSNETDVIDCSIEEVYNKNDFLKTPLSLLKRKCGSAKKNEVISLEGFQSKTKNQQDRTPTVEKIDNSLRRKLWSNFNANDSINSDNSVIASSIPESSTKNENKDGAILNNLLPGLSSSPYLPYPCKSKLNRIGQWLNENNVETVTTPPFSTNKRSSSLKPKKSSSTKPLTTSQSKKDESSDSSSIDSEVERVLVAVYGKDWKAQNVLKKSKTEPKRCKKQIFSTKGDLSNKAKTDLKSVGTARRNILKTSVRRSLLKEENLDNLESPNSLGVGKLNESGLTDDDFIRMSTSEIRRKMLSPISTPSRREPVVNKNKTNRVQKKAARSRNKPRAKVSASKESEKSTATNITPIKSFLASLSLSTPKRRCDPEAQDFKINFEIKRQELATRLYNLYNEEIFENGLPEEMLITWNVKMRRTAGYCYNKKRIKSTGEVIRIARIDLSEKIVDRADRLRDTLIHELCHAAAWIIDGMLDGHGATWTKWSRKAMEIFPELPQIKRCHNYEIFSKYTYKCSGCGYSFRRCSKSINTEKKRCGFCYGVLELFLNKKKKGKGEVPTFELVRSRPTSNLFSLFVKENYRNVRSTKRNATHAEIMRILSKKYAETKDAGIMPVTNRYLTGRHLNC